MSTYDRMGASRRSLGRILSGRRQFWAWPCLHGSP